MKRNFHILLTISVVIVFQLGFWGFAYLSQKYTKTKLINQIIYDNQAIGEQMAALLEKTGLTTQNPETDSIIQEMCNTIKLPNGGFICTTDSAGKLVSAPGLKPGMSMEFNPELQDLNKEKASFPVKNLDAHSTFTGYAYFPKEKRYDLVVTLPLGNNLRLFIHQNVSLISQKSRETTKPLLLFGLIITFFAATSTYHLSNKIYQEYRSLMEKNSKEKIASNLKIQQMQTEIEMKNQTIQNHNNDYFALLDKYSKQNNELQKNIGFAENIQKTLLSKSNLNNEIIKDHFLFFMPKNKISGDFYWNYSFDNLFFIAVVDCTGFDIQAGFMSYFGMSLLQETIISKQIKDPGIVLEYMRKNVVSCFNQENNKNTVWNSMDMALCVIDKTSRSLMFAGAGNPLICIRGNQLIELKGDKMPIGIHGNMDNEFRTQEFILKPDDIIYMFTDGFYDQFGGKEGRKFMLKNFKSLLLEIKDLPMNEQKNILKYTIVEWKGNYSQIDDITIIGLKIK